MQSNRVRLTAYFISGAWSVALLIAGVKLPGVESKVLGFMPAMVVLLFWIFDNWIWRLSWVGSLIMRPNLNGTWAGTLTSMRPDDKGTEITYPAKPVYLSIRQTFVSLNVMLFSEESRSGSHSAALQPDAAGGFSVLYNYANIPELRVRERSRPHDGTAKLSLPSRIATSCEGEYWTDRRSRGSFTVTRKSRCQSGSYEDAAKTASGGSK